MPGDVSETWKVKEGPATSRSRAVPVAVPLGRLKGSCRFSWPVELKNRGTSALPIRTAEPPRFVGSGRAVALTGLPPKASPNTETIAPGETVREVLQRFSSRFIELEQALWDASKTELGEHIEVLVNDAVLGISHTLDSGLKPGDRITLVGQYMGGSGRHPLRVSA